MLPRRCGAPQPAHPAKAESNDDTSTPRKLGCQRVGCLLYSYPLFLMSDSTGIGARPAVGLTQFNIHGSQRPLIMIRAWPDEEGPPLENLGQVLSPDQPLSAVGPPPSSEARHFRRIQQYARYCNAE